MQSSQRHMRALCAIVVRQLVGAIGRRDVNFDGDQVWLIVQVDALHVLVLDGHLIIRRQVAGQRGQSQWGKKGVLDRSPVGARRFGQSRQNQFDFHTMRSSPYRGQWDWQPHADATPARWRTMPAMPSTRTPTGIAASETRPAAACSIPGCRQTRRVSALP